MSQRTGRPARIACTLCAIALAPALANAERQPRRASRPAVVVPGEIAARGCTLDDALASQRAPATLLDSAPADAAVAAEAARTLPAIAPLNDQAAAADVANHRVPLLPHHTPSDAAAVPADPPAVAGHGGPLRFFDRDSLRAQVESIRRLPLLRLFDNREMSIYLGVDRKGVAGLHLQQRRPNESVPAADDGPPVDIPLRAVPLDPR